MFEGPLRRVPITLECVHADLSGILGDVRVENLRQEEPFGSALGEPTFNDELASKDASLVGCLHCRH